jgi:2-keto-4-pentenoate hydratase/2-oxohepta-3-ene-1,7-dioic acid hydratase in catechol pathway
VIFFKPSFRPSKIVGVGLNYIDHAEELKMAVPTAPILFIKPTSCVISDGQKIIYPEGVKELHYEAELAIVIGRHAKNVTPSKALEYVAGYTCANDVTAREQQRADGQWTRSKSYDTFCPLGPRIVKLADTSDLAIKLYLNGELKQSSRTSKMIFKIPELISFISSIMPLLPGDVIITGTPPGVGEMKRGETVEVEIEGLGRLRNTVG